MDAPLRVLHVVFSLEAGGMENGVVNVSQALAAKGYDFHACCLARAGRFAARFPHPENVHVLGKGEGFSLAAVRALSAHLQSLKPDVIHTHNLGPLLYTALATMLTQGGRKANILHGEHAELAAGELAPHRLLLRRFLYTRARRVHTVGHALKESLVSHGLPAARIEVVANGVDTSRFAPGNRAAARTQTGLPAEATVIGLVARFGEHKRHLETIEAFESLAAERSGLVLALVGGGGPREQAVRERVAASPQAARIRLAGFQEDPLPWYRAFDLLVLPSVNEGLSNALLEAMACGTPSLAHTACGSREAIRDGANGFLRDLGTPARLRAALAEALRADLPALSQAALRTAREEFGFAPMVEGYERLYALAAGCKQG